MRIACVISLEAVCEGGLYLHHLIQNGRLRAVSLFLEKAWGRMQASKREGVTVSVR